MKGYHRIRMLPWMLLVGIPLIALHVLLFNRLRSGVSFAAIAGLAILVIAKHLGALGPLYALFRRRFHIKDE